MGREQRRRRRLPPNARCYLCEREICEEDDRNRDHVPPKRIFASDVRARFGPQLEVLLTHTACNSAFQGDEEYFVASFAGHVLTPTANAVMQDLGRAAAEGHGVGLLREVIGRFGRIIGPAGEVLYTYDTARVNRFLWKLVRGIYTLSLGAVLPDRMRGPFYLVNPRNPPDDLQNIGWFPAVRDTDPLARYGAVFDYKWLAWKDEAIRAHAVAMLFWDGLIVATLFHDPSCTCGQCPAGNAAPAGDNNPASNAGT